ncbi:MAG: hypothetical protein JSU72_08035 [Deltaproteobacteria bacterium]|nr:MAG: hypothetical protein JSU72_08035 [Deltaproteobacteria bacterium]
MVVSWVLLVTGGYLGKRLHYEYVELKEQNSYLLQKKRELEALRHSTERIRKEENTIRDYLGLKENQEQRGGLGPGE